MSNQQQKESMAVNSLHEISDYTSYIDQRIFKLNLLYKTLSTEKTPKKHNSRYKIINSEPTNPKMYETLQAKFDTRRKDIAETLEIMNYTEYLPKRYRYDQTTQPFNSIQSASNYFSNDRSIRTWKKSSRSVIKSSSKNNKDTLKDFEKVKQQILSTFYVGRKASSSQQSQSKQYFRRSEYRQSQLKVKKGRVWRGRAPVKIIQKQ